MTTVWQCPPEVAAAVRTRAGTPAYVYDEATLRCAVEELLAFPHAFGLRPRFALKACPNAAVLRRFHAWGLGFDASSGWEVERVLRAGLPAAAVSLSAQELPANLAELLDAGIEFNACSLHQLRVFCALRPGGACGLRINPGEGSGGHAKTNVGGPASSFGLWHEYLGEARALAAAAGVRLVRAHTHIGSGADPAVWQRVAEVTLALAEQLPDVTTVNLGGGFKVARVEGEVGTSLAEVGAPVRAAFVAFAERTGRRLLLELEPGTFLTARAGCIVSTVADAVDTGPQGYRFVKLDCGMTEVLRPSLYGAQHPIWFCPADPGPARPTVVVGHCCESGDLLTPLRGQPEALGPRPLPPVAPGDLAVVGGAGAYCASMPAKNYNSFPEAPELLLAADGTLRLIRRRQSLAQILENETED